MKTPHQELRLALAARLRAQQHCPCPLPKCGPVRRRRMQQTWSRLKAAQAAVNGAHDAEKA